MRFGKTLEEAILPDWRQHYIDYPKLKTLLREGKRDDDRPWTEQDANRFSEELFNVQLEKVARFQEESMAELAADIDAVFDKLRDLAPPEGGDGQGEAEAEEGRRTRRIDEATAAKLRGLEGELDRLTERVRKLKQYSSINYTGFLKIAKKHDRKRSKYKVRPLLNVRLANRPINSEQNYSVLLNQLSIMYFAVRQQLEEEQTGPLYPANQGETHDGERYTAYKFWVHPDNLLEVKMHVLRRLPALVYQSHSSESEAKEDPTITSLYFDSPKFELYAAKVARQNNVTATNQTSVASVRLRWFGQLSAAPDIFAEKKVINENGTSQEQRFALKDKYVKPYVDGEYKMEKTMQKMERTSSPEELEAYSAKVEEIQTFIHDKSLSPVLRANYVRSAFQKPGDNRVRVSIDTDVAFIREDTLDARRPCRDPNSWHRTDIDGTNATYPFKNLNQGEVYRFPFAILEIKIRGDSNRKHPAWVEDLMSSHLVHRAPMFSKFAHGVAVLFDDYVNSFPSWLPDVDTDILKDPKKVFEEEEQRKANQAEKEAVIGSLIGAGSARSAPRVLGKSSPQGQSYLADRMAAEQAAAAAAASPSAGMEGARREDDEEEEEEEEEEEGGARSRTGTKGQRGGYGTISSFLPNMSLSRYGINKRKQQQQQQTELPEGVEEPEEWIKNAGDLRIEPKVWLANERTFVKWQHVAALMGSLSLALYAAAGKDTIALAMGVTYLGVACFTALWGGYVLRVRQGLIRERSGKDFDFNVGPVVVSLALAVALILNFYFQWEAALEKMDAGADAHVDGASEGVVGDAGASAAANAGELL